jgi:hypothetical protein
LIMNADDKVRRIKELKRTLEQLEIRQYTLKVFL